jgi:hypothetical protein
MHGHGQQAVGSVAFFRGMRDGGGAGVAFARVTEEARELCPNTSSVELPGASHSP